MQTLVVVVVVIEILAVAAVADSMTEKVTVEIAVGLQLVFVVLEM